MHSQPQRLVCYGPYLGFEVDVAVGALIRRIWAIPDRRGVRSHIAFMLSIATLLVTLGWSLECTFPADKAAGSVETPASTEDEEVVLSTAKTFADPQATQVVRLEAAQKLEKCGPRAAPALPLAISLFADTDWEINRAAQRIAVAVGPAAAPWLIATLTNPDDQLRFRAARTLIRIGPHAEPVVQELVPLLKHENPRIREDVIGMLPQLVPDAAVWLPALLDSLELNGMYKIKEMLRRRSTQVLPVLRSLAQSKEVATRVAAVRSLAELPDDAEGVAALFREALRDTEGSVRAAACGGLRLREVDFRTLLPLLEDRLKYDSDVKVQIAAVHALGQIIVPETDAESYEERK